jgi:hypothetical protein
MLSPSLCSDRDKAMTEAEWLESTDPRPMLAWVAGTVSERKLRLFACACCRRVWPSLAKNDKRAVETAERYSDGLIGLEELERGARRSERASRSEVGRLGLAAHAAAWSVMVEKIDPRFMAFGAADCAARLMGEVAATEARMRHGRQRTEPGTWERAMGSARRHRKRTALMNQAREDALWSELYAQASLLRCLCGNPFRSVMAIDPAYLVWSDGIIRNLVQAIYDDRCFEDMPILADALEDAGCTNTDILAHCRGPGPHARGCWVLDLLLGMK